MLLFALSSKTRRKKLCLAAQSWPTKVILLLILIISLWSLGDSPSGSTIMSFCQVHVAAAPHWWAHKSRWAQPKNQQTNILSMAEPSPQLPTHTADPPPRQVAATQVTMATLTSISSACFLLELFFPCGRRCVPVGCSPSHPSTEVRSSCLHAVKHKLLTGHDVPDRKPASGFLV